MAFISQIFFFLALYFIFVKLNPKMQKENLKKAKEAWNKSKQTMENGATDYQNLNINALLGEVKKVPESRSYNQKKTYKKKTAHIRGRDQRGVVKKGLFDKKDHGKTVERY